jgi:exosortase
MNQKTGITIATALLFGVFGWAYWPTLVGLVTAWNNQPDYAHGFLVVPVAILFLWARRESFPGISPNLSWLGLSLIAVSIVLRVFGVKYYISAVDGWTILFWVAGVVWLLGGAKVLRWSLPSILFLLFMVPLPFRLEHALSRPLQIVATRASCWCLQCLGQSALAEGNVILLGDMRLEVERACSGLRIFVGIVALAFAYLILVRCAWWEKLLLLANIVPVALAANITRIVATGLLFQWIPGANVHAMIHQYAGYLMIPYAACLFAIALWYIGNLAQTVEVADVGDIVRHQRTRLS